MEPLEIRKLLRARGANMAAVAESLDVSRTTVRKVVNGEIKSRRVALTIAIFLGRDVNDLWPEKYPDHYSRRSDDHVLRAQLSAAANLAEKKAHKAGQPMAQAA